MKRNNLNHVIEYLSMTLVLSYFFIYNIYLVLIGIILSFYLINNNFINRAITDINKSLFYNRLAIQFNLNNKKIKKNPIKIETAKEDTNLTLVETIEELGFIPSLEKNDESNIA